MFSISKTVDDTTYTISGDTFMEFVAAYSEVEGLDGFILSVDSLAAQNAAHAVAPIAAADQAAPESPPNVSDELADLIRNAPDTRALESLWRAHKETWNGEYNKLANERKKQLENKVK
jgi:hypothetical protein